MKHKSLLLSSAAALAAVAVGIGGTFALFSDTETANNTITAGRLCIESQRDAFDNVPGPMFYMTGAQGSNGTNPGRYPLMEVSPTSPAGYVPPTPGGWAPGDSVTRTLTVLNGSLTCQSLDAKLTHITASLHAGSYAPLADKMKVTVRAQAPGGGMLQVGQAYLSQFLTPAGVAIAYPGPAAITMPGNTGGGFPPNLQMEFQVDFDLDTPNAYQDKDMVVDFVVHAEQAAHNP
ncbi:MAG: spore coat-associated protein [Symbiobacteriaceae bacterium]|jgi:predicted ribosomally synthesized peptide with SipW-like signal peptide|nr:spore coat-associated protein [Symbiobacteriaceae bacterium]